MSSRKLTKSEIYEIYDSASQYTDNIDDDIIYNEKNKKKKTKGKTKKKNTSNYYVKPAEFTSQILKFYSDNIITLELNDSIRNIANRLAFSPKFINYTYKEEMIGDAIIKMFQALKNKKFDPDIGNSFSYYTQIAHNAFINRIKKEKRAHESILDYKTQLYDNLIINGILPTDHMEDNGDINDD